MTNKQFAHICKAFDSLGAMNIMKMSDEECELLSESREKLRTLLCGEHGSIADATIARGIDDVWIQAEVNKDRSFPDNGII